MTSASWEELKVRAKTFCDSGGMPDSEDGQQLLLEVLRGRHGAASPEARMQYSQLLTYIRLKLGIHRSLYAGILTRLMLRAYAEGDYPLAEELLREDTGIYESFARRNNLAYVLRRHHPMDELTKSEILQLLLPGVRQADSFSVINMSLFFALCLGGEKDWRTADRLIAGLTEVDASAQTWWETLGPGDMEGHLVMYWLMRRGKISSCALGGRQALCDAVREAYPEAPEWLFAPDVSLPG